MGNPVVSGRMSHMVPQGLSPSAAMMRPLSGTGLDFVFLDARTMKIFVTPVTPVPGPSNDARAGLQEVVVTATKRPEILEMVPMGASVLSQQQIEAEGLHTIADVAAVIPGIEDDYSSEYGSVMLTNISIRGISSGRGQSTIGIYIDDAPLQVPFTSFVNPSPPTFDLSRVEVLSGPQGTLFGRDAEGQSGHRPARPH